MNACGLHSALKDLELDSTSSLRCLNVQDTLPRADRSGLIAQSSMLRAHDSLLRTHWSDLNIQGLDEVLMQHVPVSLNTASKLGPSEQQPLAVEQSLPF